MLNFTSQLKAAFHAAGVVVLCYVYGVTCWQPQPHAV
jgi:hypothetical protein